MNTRNRLPALVVGILLLAGCQSLEIPKEEAQSDTQFEAAAAERVMRVAMTIPRPRPPQTEPLVLERALPEPGVPALPESLSFSAPNPNRHIIDGPADLPIRPAEPEAPPRTVTVPYVLDRSRENRLSPRSRAVEEALSAFSPSSAALTGREDAPAQAEAAPAGESVSKVARAPTAITPRAGQQPSTATEAVISEDPAPAAYAGTARPQGEVERPDRELVARRGDPIAIDLEGSGWIYTGLRSGGIPVTGQEQGIEYLSSRNSRNRTSFNFKAVDYGDYELTFQYQDHRQAVLRSQAVRLRVLPEQDFAAALQRQQSQLSTQPESATVGFEPEPGPPIRSADALFDLGEYELALIEYKRNMRSGDPYLNDRLAECYERTGEHLAAVKYYRENLGLEGEYGDRATVGLIRSSIATEDSPLLLDVLPSLFSLESAQIGAELLAVARFQTEQRRFSVAIQALEQYVNRYPDGRNLDEVYYRLAQIYEVDSPHRDIEYARHYYRLLWDLFPESLYTDRARERLNYLNRHFFLVQ
jgi:tetratricopeptide (TPR) repeat protein